MKKKYIKLICGIFLCLCLLFTCHTASADTYGSDAYTYLTTITSNYPARVFSTGNSAPAGDWIISMLQSFGFQPAIHTFTADGQTGRNIIVDKPGASGKMIILCAHYDSVNTQGCDDNGSGVAVLLEVAKRLASAGTPPCTLRMMFFDDEEAGSVGSKCYVDQQTDAFMQNLLCVINIDCVAGGDYMMIHGGTSEGQNIWLRELALQRAQALGTPMYTHPEVNYIPAGTRITGSDHRYFVERGATYIYLEANVYSNAALDDLPLHYQTSNPNVAGGQIMHTEYDNMAVLESIFPGRIAAHLSAYTQLMMDLALHLGPDGNYVETPPASASLEETKTASGPETETTTETETAAETETETATETETNALLESERNTDLMINQQQETGSHKSLYLILAVCILALTGGTGIWFRRKRNHRL